MTVLDIGDYVNRGQRVAWQCSGGSPSRRLEVQAD